MSIFKWFKNKKNNDLNKEENNNLQTNNFTNDDLKTDSYDDNLDNLQDDDLKTVSSDDNLDNLQDNNLKTDSSEDNLDNLQDDDLKTDSYDDNLDNLQDEKKVGFFAKIKNSLAKTRANIISNIENVLSKFKKIDEDLFEELEEALIIADIGVATSSFIIEKVKEIIKIEKIKEVEQIKEVLINVITEILTEDDKEFTLPSPAILLIIGVNGVGKTTTIAKLANNYKKEGKKVLLAAGDTFRAAAIDQLQVWGERLDIQVIKQQENSDPAAVIFDAINASKARKTDLLICDTAGRLHNKKNLMEELKKIYKIISREYENATVETLLVLDATTGQNAIQQAKLFNEFTNITGIVLTKLDGTAKGGVVISIKNELKIPIRFIGVGETLNDLKHFDAMQFAKALFE